MVRVIILAVGPEWIHEAKHDGYRLITRRDLGGATRAPAPRWWPGANRRTCAIWPARELSVSADPALGTRSDLL